MKKDFWLLVHESGERMVPMMVAGTCAVVLRVAGASDVVVLTMCMLMTVLGLAGMFGGGR